jgi:cytochrome oxidase Cu insertion factor (SCO1/SenC/PrrC family)
MKETTIAGLLVLALAGTALAADGEAQSQPFIGQPAPDFRLSDLEGRTLSLSELKGRFIVLHFGASW